MLDEYSAFVTKSVLGPIARYAIENWGASGTVDDVVSELSSALGTSSTPKIRRAVANSSSEPEAKRSSPVTKTDKNTRCCHKMASGARAGEDCGKPCVAGETKCKTHLKAEETKAAPKPPRAPKEKPAPPGSSIVHKAKEVQIDVRAIPGFPGFYRTDHGFLIHARDPKDRVVVGKIDENGDVSPLTSNDMKLAAACHLATHMPDDLDAYIEEFVEGQSVPDIE